MSQLGEPSNLIFGKNWVLSQPGELAVCTFGPRRFVRRFRGGAGSSPCVEVREEEEARGATVGRGQTAERH